MTLVLHLLDNCFYYDCRVITYDHKDHRIVTCLACEIFCLYLESQSAPDFTAFLSLFLFKENTFASISSVHGWGLNRPSSNQRTWSFQLSRSVVSNQYAKVSENFIPMFKEIISFVVSVRHKTDTENDRQRQPCCFDIRRLLKRISASHIIGIC